MANKNTSAVKMVDLFIPRPRYKDAPTQMFIAVNGQNYIVKLGEKVSVPDYIAEAYYNSEKAKDEEFQKLEEVKEKMPTE